MFIQDKRAYLNDHIEASIDGHLELTWSSLVDAKQELDKMKYLQPKFHEIQEVNQKLTESMAASRQEVRDLTLTVKSLEIANIQLKKWMEDTKYLQQKFHEIQEVNQKLTESMAASRQEVRDLTLTVKSLEIANIQLKKWMEDTKYLQQKFHEIQEVNQKLTESMAASRQEVRDLTLTVKSLEIANIQLKKWMEDMTEKMASRITTESMADTRKEVRYLKLAMQNLEMQNGQQKKSMEDMARKMAKGRPPESDLDFRKEVLHLKSAITNLELQNTREKTTMEGMARRMELEMKRLEIQMDQVKATLACEKAHGFDTRL